MVVRVGLLATYSITGVSWGFETGCRPAVGLPERLRALDPSLRASICDTRPVTSCHASSPRSTSSNNQSDATWREEKGARREFFFVQGGFEEEAEDLRLDRTVGPEMQENLGGRMNHAKSSTRRDSHRQELDLQIPDGQRQGKSGEGSEGGWQRASPYGRCGRHDRQRPTLT